MLSPEDFQKGLDLRIDLSCAAAQDLGRVTQLINKTNQFNLTTLRRSLEEVRALHASPRHRIFALRVRDRFGDYGLTGVVIVERDGEARWVIDTLLLSCRVLGRGVETALLAALAKEARAEGVREITASFLPTAKNVPAQNFLADHGFTFIAGNSWRIPVDAISTSDVVADETVP